MAEHVPMFVRNTGDDENALEVPQKKLENECFVTIEHDKSENRTLAAQELSDETITEIECTIAILQGCEVKLYDICSNWMDVLEEDDICAILESKLSIIALYLACYCDNVGAVTTLLDYKCKTDILEQNGQTALHAVCRTNLKIMSALIVGLSRNKQH
ncbi:hypothetical protein B566_EDAN005184 [Ephemera danica]|nr:hypothetical protein B566_EDAN005184 [Ephemera danica]